MTSANVTIGTPDRIADYQVVRLLGEGNHGRFYLAVPPARLGIPDEYVALKVFTGHCSEQAYDRGVRELRAFAQVSSPYLVRVYDAVLHESFLYAMEYFPGGSLAVPARPLARQEVITAMEHTALAAHALHEAGLSHGDIKPANVMLGESGAKLSDLGLARFLAPGVTLTGMANTASLEFLDPALLQGERPSRATEIWALGATLHRTLTGVGLYGELPDNEPLLAIRRLMSTQPTVAPGLSPAEADLIQACLAAPEHRPSTALEVAERLRALAD